MTRQKVHQHAVDAAGKLQPHHVAETALVHQILDGLQQVVGLFLGQFQIRIAGYPEQTARQNLVAVKQGFQILADQIFQQDHVRVAQIAGQAEADVILGRLGARHENEARYIAGAAQPGEANGIVRALELDDEVDAQV